MWALIPMFRTLLSSSIISGLFWGEGRENLRIFGRRASAGTRGERRRYPMGPMKTAGILATALALLAAPAGAQESKCTAAKHSAAGEYARALEACRAKALKRGVAVDPACEPKALLKLEAQFEKAEKKADCAAESEEGIVAVVADGFIEDLAATLQRGSGVCCKLPTSCGWVTDPALCEAADGVPGASGTVCDASGECVAAPTAGGGC